MANARMQREMHHLGIDPYVHIGAPQGRQLRGRVVPPVPPPRVSSAPIQHPENTSLQVTQTEITSRKTPGQVPDSTPTMDSSEAESIDRQLRYATSQILRDRYRLTDEESTTSEEATSPTVMNRGRLETPSESRYMTPVHQPPMFLTHEQPDIDVDNPLPNPQQKPEHLLGEVYFNHHTQVYQTLREKLTLELRNCAIYHAQRDKCFYFSCDYTWKDAPLVDFPDYTRFYWYRSGPLKIPDCPPTHSSLLTPTPPSTPQPDSPLLSAFRPIQPRESNVIDVPITCPTPVQGQPRMKTFEPPIRDEQQPFTYTPRSFSREQQEEIDRQVAIRLHEMEVARLHQLEPNSNRLDDRLVTVRNPTQMRTDHHPTALPHG